MKKITILAMLLLLVGGLTGKVQAQDDARQINLDATVTGTTVVGPTGGLTIYDDGGLTAQYTAGYDYNITVESNCDSLDTTGTRYMCFDVSETLFDVPSTDTLYIYDGPDITSPLILKRNNTYSSTPGTRFYLSANNTSGKMTIRFRSAVQAVRDSNLSYGGFAIDVQCAKPCEYILPVIDSVYDRVDLRTGEIVGHGKFRDVPDEIDTIYYYELFWNDSLSVWDSVQTDSVIRIDTVSMRPAILTCIGQGIILHGHGEYTANTGYYTPTDENTEFFWRITTDTVVGVGLTSVRYDKFQNTDCYDVSLRLTDTNGCPSSLMSQIQVRAAQNPIKTIFDLSPICNNDSLLVNVGYEGDNGTLTLKKIVFAKVVSKTNQVRTFIPDGPNCGDQSKKCFEAVVTFNEFGPGKVITDPSEICSICINYEHTYMGDYRIAIRCPTYDENVSQVAGQAVLKYGKANLNPGTSCSTCDPLAPPDSPDGSSAGSGDNTGWPNRSWDGSGSPSIVCDSLQNPFGVGLDYCWSRNGQYKLITGDDADVPTRFQPGDWYISEGPIITYDNPPFDMTPTYFTAHAGQTYQETSIMTRTPSNHEEKTNYYSPASDFSELVGCPLNGDWKAVVCDFWGADNGWIFNWSLDLCGISNGQGCEYQVGLDSVVWRPDTNRITKPQDFVDGVYKGIRINTKWNDTTAAYISSPDTSGNFDIKLSIYDEFGCQWDTMTHITTVHTPRPSLGNDTVLCNVNTMTLDATDRQANNPINHYVYTWEPFGEHTGVITTTPGTFADHMYIVDVTNTVGIKKCSARDTINVAVNPQPIPNFDPGIYPMEGCEPLTINFVNTTKNGYKYRWVFGDGTYSTLKNPTHSYAAGSYDFKYYVESEKGCKDSLIFTNLINVFPSPEASFSWEPTFPTVLNPSIQLQNRTTPDDGNNLYFWEVQYDKNNPYSFHTLTDNNPTFNWSAQAGEDISGNYTVRLIARSDNYGPSGKLTQCGDTIENVILLINNDLQFPSVVTPNGDGINDRFRITNLIEGLAFPINQLDIYDKWGSRVFHATNISKEEDFWDPIKTNTPTGTYFYRFSGKGYQGEIEHNGVIEVIK